MFQEDIGIREEGAGNPRVSAGIGGLATFIGGILPLIPFFFSEWRQRDGCGGPLRIAAHFVVGAAKTVVTSRKWWASGLEMMVAGIVVGVVAYAAGWVATRFIHV